MVPWSCVSCMLNLHIDHIAINACSRIRCWWPEKIVGMRSNGIRTPRTRNCNESGTRWDQLRTAMKRCKTGVGLVATGHPTPPLPLNISRHQSIPYPSFPMEGRVRIRGRPPQPRVGQEEYRGSGCKPTENLRPMGGRRREGGRGGERGARDGNTNRPTAAAVNGCGVRESDLEASCFAGGVSRGTGGAS